MIDTSNIVLTLDAGGTNFVFTAIKSRKKLGASVHLPAETENQEACTLRLIEGFESLKSRITEPVATISFAFPGPADYKEGIIGNLPNFPGINGNYPLKAILENHFKIPVFINNDGNLFAYGEALFGILPEINKRLEKNKAGKRFNNLIGLTLGTGFGCGIVLNNQLLQGDNYCAAEIHNVSNIHGDTCNIEESVSTKALVTSYLDISRSTNKQLTPKDVYQIAHRKIKGDQSAALKSFELYGQAIGFTIVNILNLIDGIVVIGGGMSSAWDLFAPFMFKKINEPYQNNKGLSCRKTTPHVFDLENSDQVEKFIKGDIVSIKSTEFQQEISYDRLPRTGVILSKNGASSSVSLGAYYFALSQLKAL